MCFLAIAHSPSNYISGSFQQTIKDTNACGPELLNYQENGNCGNGLSPPLVQKNVRGSEFVDLPEVEMANVWGQAEGMFPG